jgi:hypothetical protein
MVVIYTDWGNTWRGKNLYAHELSRTLIMYVEVHNVNDFPYKCLYSLKYTHLLQHWSLKITVIHTDTTFEAVYEETFSCIYEHLQFMTYYLISCYMLSLWVLYVTSDFFLVCISLWIDSDPEIWKLNTFYFTSLSWTCLYCRHLLDFNVMSVRYDVCFLCFMCFWV